MFYFTLFCYICAIALRPSLMQQTQCVCSGRLPFAMEPQTSVTDFHIIWQLLCYFTGCLLMGGTFIYDTWHRIAGITCTLHRRVQFQKTHLFGGKRLCDKNNSITAPTHFQRVATRAVVTQSAAHTLKTSPIMSTSLLGEIIQILACVWLRF